MTANGNKVLTATTLTLMAPGPYHRPYVRSVAFRLHTMDASVAYLSIPLLAFSEPRRKVWWSLCEQKGVCSVTPSALRRANGYMDHFNDGDVERRPWLHCHLQECGIALHPQAAGSLTGSYRWRGSSMDGCEGPATNSGHRNPPRHIPDFERKTSFLSETRFAPLLAISSALVMPEHVRKSRFPQEVFRTPAPQATELFFNQQLSCFFG